MPYYVKVTADRDDEDQADGDGNLFAACALTHAVTSTDVSYKSAPSMVINVRVQDDDTAGTELVFQVSAETYRVEFLGPLTLGEGVAATYQVGLRTKPTSNVTLGLTE